MLSTTPERPLPGILQEIAEVAGRDAALAIQEVKGGHQAFIVSRMSDANWLVRTVGRAKAEAISRHFTSGHIRLKVDIPTGDQSAYLQGVLSRREAMVAAIQRGAGANEIASAGGITNRSARRFRGKYLASLRKKAPRS